MKSKRLSLATLAAGWLLMVAWVAATPGLLPELFASLAKIEGSHDVQVNVGGFSASVVLAHHARLGVAHDAIHHHGKLAALLCTIAGSRDGDPDHVAVFASGSETDNDQKRNLVDSQSCVDTAFVPSQHVVRVLTDADVFAKAFATFPDPLDHAPPVFMAGLRSTQLLI